ncbi:MAG: 4-hydroxy-tetrahydrodipicolinate synthase [Leadbetterella sp.]|nr:4-hydroxy-tetrahydrodipicolinate synthase [Leadbetterella sp.]
MKELYGLGTALTTPFTEDNRVDFPALRKHLDYLNQEGIDYYVVNGTTGESATLSKQESAEILEYVKQYNGGKRPIVFGVGGNNTQAVLDTISQTDFNGVTAILSVCPYYNKPSQQGIYLHFKAIADACPVPVILYNVPGRTVISMSVETISELAKHPNIIGLKDASSSIEVAIDLSRTLPDDFLLLSGDDNLFTAQASLGYKGVISVIGNGFPKEFYELVQSALARDFEKAKKLQGKFLDFDTLLYVESNPVGIKCVLDIKGLYDGRVRLPLAKASDGLYQKMEASMRKEGFL